MERSARNQMDYQVEEDDFDLTQDGAPPAPSSVRRNQVSRESSEQVEDDTDVELPKLRAPKTANKKTVKTPSLTANDSGKLAAIKKVAVPVIGIVALSGIVVMLLPTIEAHLGLGGQKTPSYQQMAAAAAMSPGNSMPVSAPLQNSTALSPPGGQPGMLPGSAPTMPPLAIPTAGITNIQTQSTTPPSAQVTNNIAPLGMPQTAQPSASTSDEAISSATADVEKQLNGFKDDVDSSLSSLSTTVVTLNDTVKDQGAQIAELQATLKTIDADVEKLSAPPPASVAMDKPGKTVSHAAAIPTSDDALHMPKKIVTPVVYPTSVISNWSLRAISQTAAAFTNPDGQDVFVKMGNHIRGLPHGVLLKLVPYQDSWEAITTVGIIRQ